MPRLLLLAAALCPALLADDKPEARFATMTPAEVRAFELKVMRQVADFALIPPKLNTSPLPKYAWTSEGHWLASARSMRFGYAASSSRRICLRTW